MGCLNHPPSPTSSLSDSAEAKATLAKHIQEQRFGGAYSVFRSDR